MMTRTNDATHARTAPVHPAVHTISIADLQDVLVKGRDDFMAKPSHLLLLAFIYPIVGFFMAAFTFGYDMLPLLFPLVSGFALIGPLAAVGLYEMSRGREQGLDIGWMHAFEVFKSQAILSIILLGVLQMLIYFAWLGAALVIYKITLGAFIPTSISGFFEQVFTTGAGWALIIFGCGTGFMFAALVLAVSAVSFPMLVDRDVGPMVAVQTSIRAVSANPVTMAIWGLIVVIMLVIGSLPFFVGLAVVMPILGHATWHLYRKLVTI